MPGVLFGEQRRGHGAEQHLDLRSPRASAAPNLPTKTIPAKIC